MGISGNDYEGAVYRRQEIKTIFPFQGRGLNLLPKGVVEELGERHFTYRSTNQQGNKPHAQEQKR